jgi:hypothetical protein
MIAFLALLCAHRAQNLLFNGTRLYPYCLD